MDRKNKLLGHAERNMALLQVFQKKKVDIKLVRPVEFHFWAWGQPSSVRLAHELYNRGFIILLLKPALLSDDPERWNIEAGNKMSISSVIEERFTETLVDVASMFDAEYDGWGTSV